ncbi:MAG: hypothetical protein L3J93_02550 [Thermoplasmata archaeon]|nr:hypothetical protein [Thermoplasmata archaeon]
MSGRETAWRVLAHEFSQSTEEERGTGDRVASYVLSPLGAKMNRVLLVGTLSAAEAIGRDAATPFFRTRLTDPTGFVLVTAGGFQPRALEALRNLKGPQDALVVGKTHLFVGRDGVAYPSVRAEAIRALPSAELEAGLAEAAEQTLARIALVKALESTPAPSDEALRASGYPRSWIRAAREVRPRYPSRDPESFRPPIEGVLAGIRSHAPRESVRGPAPAPPRPVASRDPPARDHGSATFLDLLDELAEGSSDGFADLGDLLERAGARGIDSEVAERILVELEEAGAIEEPVVGKLRRTEPQGSGVVP